MNPSTVEILHQWSKPNSYWKLLSDGTLFIQGEGRLSGDDFRSFQDHITRIEVKGHDTIDQRMFAFLPYLREVILDPTVTVIEEKAFYCCCQLLNVSLGRKVDIEYDSFHGTPLQGECLTEAEIEEFESQIGEYIRYPLPNPLEHTGENDSFWYEVEAKLRYFEHSLAYEEALTPAIELLRQSAEEGEPALMYLWAEFLMWGSFTADRAYGNVFLNILPENEEVQRASSHFKHENNQNRILLNEADQDGCIWTAPDAHKWYVRAALAGYTPAISWLAWCAKRGILTKPSEAESAKWIAFAGKFPPAAKLLHRNLNTFVESAKELGHSAYAADLEEDIAFDRGYEPPWPTWKDLLSASMITYKLGCMFGCPRCALPIHEFQAYDYESCDSLQRRRMCVEKRMWQIWSGLNGVGVEKASKEQLTAWLTDIHRAVDYGESWKHHMNLDENTENLIRMLKEEVQLLHDA